MKIIYRIIILAIIFAGALYYFGSNMQEQVFSIEKKTMDMSEATLPYVTMQVDGEAFNLLHGYAMNLDTMMIRESITPLTSEQDFSVLITENESIVKKIKYEISDINEDSVVESGTINALEKTKDYKIAKIKIKQSLSEDVEYVVKLILITDQSKRIYFYTRIKVLPVSNMGEKLSFVENFRRATIQKSRKEEISKYLETAKGAVDIDFAHVTLESSLFMVTYGELQPNIVYQQIPTITEVSKDAASVVVTSIISVETGSGLEYYRVKECFRFSYSTRRVYLYNYEREMQSIFDVNLTSLSKSEFKIGITDQKDLNTTVNADHSMVAFVHNKQLLLYHLAENKLVQVFSFQSEDEDYVRDDFEQHDIKILNVDDVGNISFIVYGYMNRGEYEGRVGIVLYVYDRVQGTIEEQMYIPINATYEMLKGEVGEFVYKNQYDIVYISVFDTIYSYNLSTKQLEVIAEHVPSNELVYAESENYVAYNETTEVLSNQSICIVDLEKGTLTKIDAPENGLIQLLGKIDSNLIYGYAKKEDIIVKSDGKVVVPMYEIIIADRNGHILKNYQKDGYFITDIKVDDNVVMLERIVRDDTTDEFLPAEADYILNQASNSSQNIGLSKRVTNLMLTEYYLPVATEYKMEKIPIFEKTKNVIITEDTTVRVNPTESLEEKYFAYSFGRIIEQSRTPGIAVATADEHVGTVLRGDGKIIWERGVKPSKFSLKDITNVGISSTLNSVQACLKMFFRYKSVEMDTSGYKKQDGLLVDFMDNNLKGTSLDLKGATLDQVLYYVGNNTPVIAYKDEGKAVLIIAYDSTSITVLDPERANATVWTIKEATDLFKNAGSIFYSYLD